MRLLVSSKLGGMLPFQIRFVDDTVRLTASVVPYGVSVVQPFEFGFIVEEDGQEFVLSPEDFACHDASCRPPTSGGTGGSQAKGGTVHIAVGKAPKGQEARSAELADMTPAAQKAALGVINSIAGMEDVKTVDEAVDKVTSRLMATVDIATGHDLLRGNLDGSPSGPYDAERIQATSRWYDVANKYVGEVANTYGFNHVETSAAVFATLSPGAPWPSNVRNGEQVMKFVGENKKVGAEGVKDIQYRAGKVLEGERAKLKKEGQSLDEIDARIAANASKENFDRLMGQYGSKKFNDLDEDVASFLIQGNTQRHSLKEIEIDPRPDGSYTSTEGKSKAIIQSSVNFSKAIRMARADKNGATESELAAMISSAVSQESKARAFFMNIAHPMDRRQDAVTLDTHAYGALTGVPLSLNTSGRFFVSSKEVGYANTYPIMREAMKRVGAELRKRGMADLPGRAVQSVVWEMERAILPDKGKSAILKAGDLPGTITAQAAELYRQGRDLEAKTLIARAAGGIA